MTVDKTNVTQDREDVSRFVVHITRCTTDGLSDEKELDEAGLNLISILRQGKIEARGIHCLHGKKLGGVPDNILNQFKVVCFTEVPLHQIHLLIRPIKGRQIKFQPYGLVFRKRFLIESGAQPAIYINNYGKTNTFHREGADALLNFAKADGFKTPAWRLLPLLNAMNEAYDFTWEREWRVCGDFAFFPDDLVCIILPNDGDERLKTAAAKVGLAAISPGWTYEQIVEEMSKRQRQTRTTMKKELGKLKAALPDKSADEEEPKKP